MERLPHGRQQHRRRLRAGWVKVTVVAGSAALIGVILPAGAAGASSAAPSTLKATLAQVKKLSNKIDAMSDQYDSLRIQLHQARREAAIARRTVRTDQKLLTAGQAAIGQIAAQGYMDDGVNPTLQLLQTKNPQQYLNRASIMLQLQKENGDKVSLVSAARTAALRARLAADQEERNAVRLSHAMKTKVAVMQADVRKLNSRAYSQAMAIYTKTGHYPYVAPTGHSVEIQALRYALTRRGDWYVWGAAGPTTFDCSGLVKWAYAQIGIDLPHFTGADWNLGVHVSRADLQPGDLVFFFEDEHHMGIYVGNGMFLDAPATGQQVQIQPMMWDVYDGAVRIG